MRNKTWSWIIGVSIVAVTGFLLWTWLAIGDDTALNTADQQQQGIASFEECVAAGNPVMESHPRQCSVPDGKTFVEELSEDGDETEDPQDGVFTSEKGEEIHFNFTEGETISSPYTLSGEVPGNWSFEADFPVELLDSDGGRLAMLPATLQGDWMTEELVPFTVEIEFPDQPAGSNGTLILHKDNASGLSEHDDRLELEVSF